MKSKHTLTPLTLCLVAIISACTPAARGFDSTQWKAASASVRGAMAQDLMDRQVLIGKSRLEVEALLGSPDNREAAWLGYKVVTISRCYFWECRMAVVFEEASDRVKDVAVSD